VQGSRSLEQFEFNSMRSPATLATGALVELMQLSAPQGRTRNYQAVIDWLGRQPRPCGAVLDAAFAMCRNNGWRRLWEQHCQYHTAINICKRQGNNLSTHISALMPWLNSAKAMYQLPHNSTTANAAQLPLDNRLHRTALHLARAQSIAATKAKVRATILNAPSVTLMFRS
jgi:hypothetical protein